MIGLFAAAEAFKSMENPEFRETAASTLGRLLPPWVQFRKILPTIGRSTVLGVLMGMIPGAGADVAAFVAYSEAKRFSKTPENFGKGELAGVAAASLVRTVALAAPC